MLVGNITALQGGGVGSTMTTFEWAFTIMGAKPQVMAKLQQEVDAAFGRDGTISYQDRHKCPYLQAFLWEVWRWKSLAPLNIPRRTTEDTSVGGHFIPKDTQVILNFWAIDHDPKIWDKPDDFMPERFLSADKKEFVRLDHAIPFSYGKRSCPGEPMGLASNFLYLACFVQKFNIRLTLDAETALEPKFALALQLKHKPMIYFDRRS